jgi:nucleoside-diphosphate-sugar epimerase
MMDEIALELMLSEPVSPVVEAMASLQGDLLVLGAGGKMGPSLARLARRASVAAGIPRRVIAVSRFGDDGVRRHLEEGGVETIACDLFDPIALGQLPEAPLVIYMAGQKFGTEQDSARTWAINAFLPGLVATRFADSRIVAFSTGNVYPLWPFTSDGPTEDDATGPVGEYALSALARERVLEFCSRRCGTPIAILRLNYAVEPRYGVLRDIADRVKQGALVDVAMGKVNLIWQRDANAVALRALEHCASPPLVLNVTGTALEVRWLAAELGKRFRTTPRFVNEERETALLSNPERMQGLFGMPSVGIELMLDRVAEWVLGGGRSLGKPTHFEERSGKF